MPSSGSQISLTIVIEDRLVAVAEIAEDLGMTFHVGPECVDVKAVEVAPVFLQEFGTLMDEVLVPEDENSSVSGVECQFVFLSTG